MMGGRFLSEVKSGDQRGRGDYVRRGVAPNCRWVALNETKKHDIVDPSFSAA